MTDSNVSRQARDAWSVRPASPADAPFAYRLMCDLESHAFDREAFDRRYLALLSDGDRYLCLVGQDSSGVPQGFLSLRFEAQLHHERPVAEVLELIVDPAARGQGAGTRLLERAFAIARDRGCELIELSSNVRRTRAHAFYEAHGMGKTHWHLTMPIE